MDYYTDTIRVRCSSLVTQCHAPSCARHPVTFTSSLFHSSDRAPSLFISLFQVFVVIWTRMNEIMKKLNDQLKRSEMLEKKSVHWNVPINMKRYHKIWLVSLNGLNFVFCWVFSVWLMVHYSLELRCVEDKPGIHYTYL